MKRRLAIPAPSRCWYKTEDGWASRRWTLEDVKSAQEGGAYFVKGGRHHFADRVAAQRAGQPDEI